MAMNVNTVGGDQLSGAKRAMPGWFHANITQLKETDKCDGIEVHGSVLAGKPTDSSVSDFVDSSFKFTLWYPDASKPEEMQTRNNARLTALLIATDLVTPAQLGQPLNVDEQLAIGRHVLVHLCYARKKEGDKWVDNPPYLDLAFNDLLHVDDPAGANVPKHIGALKFVNAQLRHLDPKYFDFKAKPSSVVQSTTTQTQPAAGAAGGF